MILTDVKVTSKLKLENKAEKKREPMTFFAEILLEVRNRKIADNFVLSNVSNMYQKI